MLSGIGFDFEFEFPFVFIKSYFKAQEVENTALSICLDSYYLHPYCIFYEPELIAAACIQVALDSSSCQDQALANQISLSFKEQ